MPQIHHEVTFPASPSAVYAALVESARHAEFTGAPAEIERDEGGTFVCYGGHVEGRHVQLVPGKRIVQAWRTKTWPEGTYSVARFELTPDGSETKLVFDQDGVPAEAVEHIDAGWHRQYWEKLTTYLR